MLRGDANEQGGAVSPDGRWILYGSSAGLLFEAYIAAFPGAGARRQVSTTGADVSANGGDSLFKPHELMAAAVRVAGDGFKVGIPRVLHPLMTAALPKPGLPPLVWRPLRPCDVSVPQ